jgi:DNA phosphorothioation-dependent restriction protein DptF
MDTNVMLKEALSHLKESSKSAIADADCDSFDDIKSYLHLERDIEGQLISFLESVKGSSSKKLFLVCGNVGDGKSHLLASIKINRPDLLSGVVVHNDATESSAPNMSYIDELNKLLLPFSDHHISAGDEKIVLAINLGTLNNFLSADVGGNFSSLRAYVQVKKILGVGDIVVNGYEENSPFQFVNFCDHNLFHLTKNGPISEIIETAIEKIVNTAGPFYRAYEKQKTLVADAKCPICFNFEVLQQKSIRKKIAGLIIECIIKGEVIVSIRALYNFIYELIVPIDLDPLNDEALLAQIKKISNKEFLDNILPNYLFTHPELSEIFFHIQQHDPSFRRGEGIDETIVELMVSDYKQQVLERFIAMDAIGKDLQHIFSTFSFDSKSIHDFVRVAYFWPNGHALFEDNSIYKEYMGLMFDCYAGNTKELKPLYKLIQNAVVSWRGHAGTGKINVEIGRQQLDYRISEAIEIKPEPPETQDRKVDTIKEFNIAVPVKFIVAGKQIPIAVTYSLYALFIKIQKGYRPTSLDHSNFVVFDEFVQLVVEAGTGQKQIFVTESANKKQFVLELDEFGDFCFSEVIQ